MLNSRIKNANIESAGSKGPKDISKTSEKVKAHFKDRVFKLGDEDKEFYHSCINVPKVNKVVSFIVLILNLLLPGTGTFLAACLEERNYVSKS